MSRLSDYFELARHGSGRNISGMEGLRGFAVFLVFLVHYTTLCANSDESGITGTIANAAFVVGNSGVDLFFVLSGYLIYGSLVQRPQPYLKFMRRRVIRIYPAFTAVLSVYIVLCFLFPSESKLPENPSAAVAYLAANFLLLPGIFPLDPLITVAWSLSYEMCFYIVAPIFIGLFGMRNHSSRTRLGLLIAFSLALAATALRWGGPVRLLPFLEGAILSETVIASLWRAPGAFAAAAAAFLGWSCMLLPLHGHGWTVMKTLVLCVSLGTLCHHLFCRHDGFLVKVFNFTPLRWLGNMSYSYYLIHGLALKSVFYVIDHFVSWTRSSEAFWVLLPLLFVISLVPASVLFLAVERPISLAKAHQPASAPAFSPERATIP